MNNISQLNYIEQANLRINAEKIRSNLVAQNLATYRIEANKKVKTIVCLCCGFSSSNINDVEQKYCGFCHTFHE